ncbi:MAG: hypothetical protein JNM07_04305 [Phycisphaerae bacterium]|nr:hypothetical protein [Phycisphaerae bacterium]
MRTSMMSAAAMGAAVLVGAAGAVRTASAQCNFSWLGIPDFDQRRSGSLWDTGSGLPGEGGWYCVPTSMVNLMAYLSNQGFPEAMNRPGPSNWQNSNNYYWVSGYLTEMGNFMGTGASSGTGSNGWVAGTEAWLQAVGLYDEFSVYWHGSSPEWTPSPIFMHVEMDYYGSLVAFAHGPYAYANATRGWYRTGGHICTLFRTTNACGNTPSIGYKDPWTSDSKTSQSAFSSASTALQGDNVRINYEDRLQWRMVDISDANTRRYIDEVCVMRPNFVFTGTSTDGLKLRRLFKLPSHPRPMEDVLAGPGGRTIKHVALDDATRNLYIVSTPGLFNNPPPRLWSLDPSTMTYTNLMDTTALPTSLLTDRRGYVILAGDGSVRKLKIGGRTPTIVQQDAGGVNYDDLAIDDATDTIYALDEGTRTIRRYPGGNLTQGVTNSLDTPVPFSGKGSLAINPVDGTLWLASQGVTNVRKIGLHPPATGGPNVWQVEQTASNAAMTGIEDLQFSNTGKIQILSGGKAQQFKRELTGAWSADTTAPLHNLPAKNFLFTTRSRTNFDPALHTGPGWDNNVLDPHGGLQHEVRDCPADFNIDGVVDDFDYFDFLNAFFSNDPDADINGDTSIDDFDFFDFLNSFNTPCA